MHEFTHAGVASGSTPGVRPFAVPASTRSTQKVHFVATAMRSGSNARPLVRRGLAVPGELRAVDDVARLIGTRHRAVAAADAQIVVDRDHAVGALLRRGRRAHVLARRIAAVHAADRHEDAPHVRELAGLDVEHLAPLHARRRRVRVLARRGARLAADAPAQVHGHRPAGQS